MEATPTRDSYDLKVHLEVATTCLREYLIKFPKELVDCVLDYYTLMPLPSGLILMSSFMALKPHNSDQARLLAPVTLLCIEEVIPRQWLSFLTEQCDKPPTVLLIKGRSRIVKEICGFTSDDELEIIEE